MKRILNLLMIAGALLLVACSSAKENKDIEIFNREIVFTAEDALGDDNGPGTYAYPTGRTYINGAYDLLELKVDNVDDTSTDYEFTITINSYFKNDAEFFGGWDIQMFDIYLNTGEGKHRQAIAGRNLKIRDGWDKAVIVAPEREVRIKNKVFEENKEVSDDISDYEDLTGAIYLPDSIYVDNNKLIIRVSKDKLGSWNEVKGIQLFALGFTTDPSDDYTYNMDVEEFTGQNNFGGGTNYEGNSNVLDILGDNSKMADYKSEDGISEFAEVDLIKVN